MDYDYERYIRNREDIDLIRKDVCARLKTGLFLGHIFPEEFDGLHFKLLDEDYWKVYSTCEILQSIPVLRPMSSMTDEEKAEYNSLLFDHTGTVSDYCAKIIDFYIAHYLDFRGLIEKGLALEAPDGMYRFKKTNNYGKN